MSDDAAHRDAHKIRTLAKLSKTEAAAMARVAPLTWRLYEADRNAVSEEKRRDCDAALDRMSQADRNGEPPADLQAELAAERAKCASLHDRNRALEDECARLRAGQ